MLGHLETRDGTFAILVGPDGTQHEVPLRPDALPGTHITAERLKRDFPAAYGRIVEAPQERDELERLAY